MYVRKCGRVESETNYNQKTQKVREREVGGAQKMVVASEICPHRRA